jgi:hypothetical protein
MAELPDNMRNLLRELVGSRTEDVQFRIFFQLFAVGATLEAGIEANGELVRGNSF